MGDKVATKYEHVSGTLSESMVNIPLDEMDVQRWLYNRAGTEEYPMGLYVEAMHEGENLAYHPISNFREVGSCYKTRAAALGLSCDRLGQRHHKTNNGDFSRCTWNWK